MTGMVEPFAMFDWALSWQKEYIEKGADPFNFIQKPKASSLVRSEVGLRLYQQMYYPWGFVTVQEKGSFVNKTPFNVDTMTMSVIGAPYFALLETFQDAQNLGSAGLTVIADWGKLSDKRLSVSYTGEFGEGFMTNQFDIKFSYDF